MGTGVRLARLPVQAYAKGPVAKYSGKKGVSDETRREAMALAKGTQSPGQTKAQTRLIAQGIERGIDLYKKQHKEKARAQDKRQREKRPRGAGQPVGAAPAEASPSAPARLRWLPWVLLVLTWTGIGAYWLAGPG